MADRRKNKRKPFAVPADRPGAAAAPPPVSRPRRLAMGLGLPLASALLLTLAFPPLDLSWLAYVALAPLMIAMRRVRTNRAAFGAAFLAGFAFFGINVYWIIPISPPGTVAGWAVLAAYLALYWALFGWGVRRIARATRAPLTLLAPTLWVTLEFVRGWFVSGLPWLFVGHTQYANLTLIQTADALGAYGASFLCLMTSGLVVDLLGRPIMAPSADGRPPRFSRAMILMVVLTCAAWAGTIGYGLWRLGQTAARPGPVVASVQTCVPQDLKNLVKAEQMQTAEELRREIRRIKQAERDMMDDQLRLTRAALGQAQAAGVKLDLVVWPETMVPGTVNREFLEHDREALDEWLGEHQERSRGFWEEIVEEAKRVRAPILFGGHASQLGRDRAGDLRFVSPQNAAFLVSPASKPYAADHTYAKAHLVPFGEYVPFKKSWPWLYNLLRGFTPYDFDYSLVPGEHDQAPFLLRYDGGREARFQVAICYEDAMAYRIREMVRPTDPSRPKAVDFIVNISNDGWFNGSIELDQHLNLCVFRAVENRVAIVRSVNTGISALIAPDGRIESYVQQDGRRRNVKGQIVGRLTLDDRAAPYTRVGDVFALACLVAAAGLAAATILKGRGRQKGDVP